MRVVVTGATGNLGTSLLERLAADAEIKEVVAVARRQPARGYPRTRFVTADVATDRLDRILEGADAVVHLAWRLQPARDLQALDATNVKGSRRVAEAAARAGVKALLVASSVGTYGPGAKEPRVDEAWDTRGIEGVLYASQKAQVERILDEVEAENPALRVVRMRPALVFRREAASDIRRLFIGPFFPRFLFSARSIPVVPVHERFRFQCVHGRDVAAAFQAALHRDVRGPFNLAAEPVIDGWLLAEMLGARPSRIPLRALRAGMHAAFMARVLPVDADWFDMALGLPLMSSAKARRELGWSPEHAADETLRELLDGLRRGAGIDTPPMAPRRGLSVFRPVEPQPR